MTRRRRHIALVATLVGSLLFALIAGPQALQRNDDSVERQLKLANFQTYIDLNGTLQVGRKPSPIPCRYFTGTNFGGYFAHDEEIKKLHYKFDDCAENQLGNRLGEHYLNYLLANAARIPYQMSCGDMHSNSTVQVIDLLHKTQQESVLRHLAVDLQEPGPVPVDPWGHQQWSPTHVCSNCCRGGWWCQMGLNLMFDVIVADMRKLAKTEVGLSFHPEDAVIHLRLGDALKGKKDEGIGLLPHNAYSDILQKVAAERGKIKTIGIVTQPFSKNLVRSFDMESATLAKSRLVTFDLVKHLKKKFPHAEIKIHNNKDEVPLKSYARLVRAQKVAICGASTFCTMPVLATEGLGYLFRGEKHSPWAKHIPQFQSNIRSFKVPRLANNFTDKLDDEQLLGWLRKQSPLSGEFCINEPPLIRNM